MKRVFISFIHDDRPLVNGLRLLAANPNFELEFYDESVRTPVNSTNSEYIKRVIRDKIARSSVTLCLISKDTFKSDWVDWELAESEKAGNKIVAMALKGIENAILPTLIHQKQLPFHAWAPDLLAALVGD
jgi:hypothetical protein